jgi:response regulator RpfG family c-di-GMP phosphodiesterase
MKNEDKKLEKICVLYVDDEEHNLISFKAGFRKEYKVLTANSAEEARKILDDKDNEVHIIITDQRMPEETGVEFLSSIIQTHAEPIRMLLTGYTDIEAVIDAINKGQVYRYITKPWNEYELKVNIDNAYEVYSLRKNNLILLDKLEKANSQLEFLLRQKLLD